MEKEVNLEKGSLSDKIDTRMAIFSLKQLGWSNNPSETPYSHGGGRQAQTLAEFMKQQVAQQETKN